MGKICRHGLLRQVKNIFLVRIVRLHLQQTRTYHFKLLSVVWISSLRRRTLMDLSASRRPPATGTKKVRFYLALGGFAPLRPTI